MANKAASGPVAKICFRIVRRLVRIFYPRITVQGADNLGDAPTIVVGNHTQMHGPICAELYHPRRRLTWCAAQMMHLREVPAYAYRDFWSQKPTWCRWFYRLLSFIIAPLSVCVFNNAATIPVYHDGRLLSTFRQTVSALKEGIDVIIFPECAKPHNTIVYEFQQKFVDVASLYYRRTGQCVQFTPVYIAPSLRVMQFGSPVRFSPDTPIEQERKHICEAMMNEITAMAEAMPPHRVVPYMNVPKRRYPLNRAREGSDEKTRC